MNSKDIHHLFGGVLIGLVIGIGVIIMLIGPGDRERYQLKTACEQNLPRNQECELQYVPSKVIK
ncbi:hypothetical protein MIF8_9 [Erwinia phage MIF8]